jgi:hypothetical protein
MLSSLEGQNKSILTNQKNWLSIVERTTMFKHILAAILVTVILIDVALTLKELMQEGAI